MAHVKINLKNKLTTLQKNKLVAKTKTEYFVGMELQKIIDCSVGL